jgi:predicted CoA-substrate-specific enzyme activase
MNHNTPLYMGLDIGSVSVNAVVLDEKCGFVYDRYIRSHGRPLQVVSDVFREVAEQFPWRLIRTLAVTGSGADLVLENYGGRKINEVVAQAQGVLHYYPQVKTVIEMGGEDSKLIILKNGSLVDFSMNSICAAGTGSFLDQQATRLKINIENEFGELALKSVDPPRIAGRCSVFAKSDMIHLQQIATPDYDILAGLCFAMARNFKGTVARGRILETPVSFQGGVAANAGMVRAIREVFELTDDQLIIPERHSSMGAAGAALTVKVSGQDGFIFPDLGKLTMIQPHLDRGNGHPPLEYNYPASKHYSFDIDLSKKAGVVSGYLGIDVGSLSTNLVIIDSENNVLAREYLMTEGRPLEAICRGLKKIEAEVGEKVRIKAAGTTGSGRYLTADFVGADLVKNEITCQATAAIALDPTVDTIFEIGGQDSKYVSIDNGVVIDFEMNKACAAGTGSFLQEQAEKLGIKIEDEFSHLAFGSECPVGCGERCTVFMESDLVSRQQAGACKEDLVAGLAYSIVHNYLNKVVAGRRVGERIFFQGGVAWNKSVVAAFEKVLDKEIIVPPNHDVTGAIGAAILARDHVVDGNTGFKGFGLYKRSYILTSFTCEDCPNSCHIHKIEREGDGDLYYGSRCEKYESRGRPKNDLVDTVAQRNRIMFGAARAGQAGKPTGKGKKIVLPLAVSNWDLYPFWGRFFDVLGHRVKLSGKTTRDKINRGCDIVASETCFPVKIAHGHLTDKTALEADFIFLPSVVAMPPAGEKEKFRRYFCPYIQSLPYIIRAALGDDKKHITEKIIHANIDFHLGPKAVARWLYPLGKRLGNGKREVDRAFRAAMDCYNDYRRRLREKGNEFLDRLPDDRIALVIVGRP